MSIKSVSRFLSRNQIFEHATVIQTKETEHVNLKVFSAFCIYSKQLLSLGLRKRRCAFEILGLTCQHTVRVHKQAFMCKLNNLDVQLTLNQQM